MSCTNRRRVAGLALVGAAAIALTACGGGSVKEVEGNASAPTLPSAQSEEEANASADAQASTSSAAGPSTNQRGNIVKTLGEEGGVTAEDGTFLYTFAFDSITPDVPCTEEYASDPENGHLTAVKLRLSTGAVTPDQLGYLSVSGYDFKFIGSDGLTFTNVSTAATYSCLDQSALFPSAQLSPGSQYAGVVLLDLPEAAGTLIYQPSYLSAGGGWEISY